MRRFSFHCLSEATFDALRSDSIIILRRPSHEVMMCGQLQTTGFDVDFTAVPYQEMLNGNILSF